MSTAEEIKHPAVQTGSIDPSYIVFGVVDSYTYIKWVREEGQEEWVGCCNNHERVVVVWGVIDSLLTAQRFIDINFRPCNRERQHNTTMDVDVEIQPTYQDNLKVLCKRNSCKLGGLNDFFMRSYCC